MNNLRISNLGNPVNPQDAMTFVLNPTYYVSGLVGLTDWIRMYTISGTEGSVIDCACEEKNTGGAGSTNFSFRLHRAYNSKYSVIVYPWANGNIFLAVSYSEIWMKRNTPNTNNNLNCTLRLLDNLGDTVITTDGNTHQTANPNGFIDTSGGPDMYYVNRYPQVKNPLVPIFTTNAKYVSAGFTITAPNGIIAGNNPFDPFDGNNWKSADTTNSYLRYNFQDL